MTILITGGAGFIGGHTVLALLDRGEIPIVLDDLSTGTGRQFRQAFLSLPATSEIRS
jgi:UDP-glucose 4-epimerase